MYIIKLTAPVHGWPLSSQKEPYLKHTPKYSGIWGNYQFFVNSPIETCDYWVVFEQLENNESCICSPKNTILITGEPPSIKKYRPDFLNQFEHIITCHKNIVHQNVHHHIQGHSWFVNKNYDELSSMGDIKKTRNISIITSNKVTTEGQRKRYEFALKLKDYFGDRIDLFGNGILKFEDKWDVLAPYKYSMIIENERCDDWITEKLFDCYLAHTFPFYYGCSNIMNYYNDKSYVIIDINDIKKSINIINNILEKETFYLEHLNHVLEAKKMTLEKYHLFAIIVDYIENNNINADNKKEIITIEKEKEIFFLKRKFKTLMRKCQMVYHG